MIDLNKFKKIDDLNLRSKRVLVRVDLNVPIKNGVVTDDTRIKESLPTIKKLQEKDARIILMSHLGRPKGKKDRVYSLEPVAAKLAELINQEIIFADDCIGDGPKKLVGDLKTKGIVVLENLRFYAEEEANDEKFSEKLAELGDVYINDAFGTAHRAHASTAGVARYFKEKGIGLLMEKEINSLSKLLSNAEKPFVLILGGAKVSDKIGVIENLLARVNSVLIGGAMANTFLKGTNHKVGASKTEEDFLPTVRHLIERAKQMDVEILLPVDVIAAQNMDETKGNVYKIDQILDNLMALDIGPETIKLFDEKIKRASTIFWNGPMGVFEKEPFMQGTMEVCRSIARSVAFSVVGGGDSLSAVKKSGLEKSFKHLSTGGGASLEFMEGKVFPALQALV